MYPRQTLISKARLCERCYEREKRKSNGKEPVEPVASLVNGPGTPTMSIVAGEGIAVRSNTRRCVLWDKVIVKRGPKQLTAARCVAQLIVGGPHLAMSIYWEVTPVECVLV
jgi:hypothetical protein